MVKSFKFIFPTFDIDEPNEIILDVPLINNNNVNWQSSEASDDIFESASVNLIKEIIVTEMMRSVKEDFSMFTKKKA